MTYGVDVSENNGRVDWQAVANAGMKFAIVRSSYGRYARDEDFIRNVNGAHDVGLQCGAYHYRDSCPAKSLWTCG
jgi:GH25 family lysozyme M1 (1,4-beta-N-acetylmuramidase)